MPSESPVELADQCRRTALDPSQKHVIQKSPSIFQCVFCPKRFTRDFNRGSHLRTHADDRVLGRPFVCAVCGKAFTRQHDCKSHERLHTGEKRFVCQGELHPSGYWGCGQRFARAGALKRHFRTGKGQRCRKPLLDEQAAGRLEQELPNVQDNAALNIEDRQLDRLITQPALSIERLGQVNMEGEQATNSESTTTVHPLIERPPDLERRLHAAECLLKILLPFANPTNPEIRYWVENWDPSYNSLGIYGSRLGTGRLSSLDTLANVAVVDCDPTSLAHGERNRDLSEMDLPMSYPF